VAAAVDFPAGAAVPAAAALREVGSMKSANEFFTKEEQQRIEAAVAAVESRSSGEIVPMLVDSSYEYPHAELIGGGSLALGAGLLVSWGFGGESIWWFLAVFIPGFFLFQQAIRRLPELKRRLIHPDELTAEVKEKAQVSFLEQGLHETRDRTGILILISLFEHRVQVLADSGINARVPEHTWEELVAIIIAGLRAGDTCNALCQAIDRCGELLREHFPAKADDSNELPNLIIKNHQK
jgi:putative membrane protein